jgi:glutathione peroxidase
VSKALFDIEITSISGERGRLADHKGKVILVVNTASRCGLTPQFEGLEALYQAYAARGFVVLGFPSSQFAQELAGNEAIAEFCLRNYGVSFPMHEKIDVNGPRTHPLFRHLKRERPGLLNSEAIKWNFTKFLIDRQGRVVDRIAPRTEPAEIRRKVERLLGDVSESLAV